jgi:plasmid stabilization system protein ParE
LATLSDRGRVVPELDDQSIRELFVFEYRLMYRVEEARVVVVSFLHGAREFAAWRSKQGLE